MSETYNSQRYDQSTMTDRLHGRLQWVSVLKDWLQILSSILLPLMIGVFTVIVTFQQQNMARVQRLEDLNSAREQREQDLNISRQQRYEDQETAREQRALDKETALLQRANDVLRRELDLEIAEAKRKHDDLLAAQQRNLSDSQKNHELERDARRYEREMDKYLDSLLVTYMTEIGYILKANNGSSVEDFVVRGKTLALIRQLDSARKTHLLRFLYEAGQLTDKYGPPMNLYYADLDNIDLSKLYLPGISLAGANLKNVSFVDADLAYGNFTHINGSDSDFTSSKLYGAQFNFAILNNATFASINGTLSSFDHADLRETNFGGAHLLNASFIFGNLADSNFSNAYLVQTNFTFATLNRSSFTRTVCVRASFNHVRGVRVEFMSADLNDTSFRHAFIMTGQFQKISASKINFADSSLFATSFEDALISDSDFTYTKLHYPKFVRAHLSYINFTQSTLITSNFNFSTCINVDFAEANISGGIFSSAIVNNGFWWRSIVPHVVFTNAKISNTNFQMANLGSAIFTGAIIHGIYLMNANLLRAKITDEQLQQARSIAGAVLPNGTVAQDRNMIINGHVDCDTNLSRSTWKVLGGDIAIVAVDSGTNCRFQSTGNNTRQSILTQSLNALVPMTCRESSFAVFRARFGGSTLVSLIVKDNTYNDNDKRHVRLNITLFSSNHSIRVPLDENIILRKFEIRIEFFGLSDDNFTSAWCDDIQVTLQITDARCRHRWSL